MKNPLFLSVLFIQLTTYAQSQTISQKLYDGWSNAAARESARLENYRGGVPERNPDNETGATGAMRVVTSAPKKAGEVNEADTKYTQKEGFEKAIKLYTKLTCGGAYSGLNILYFSKLVDNKAIGDYRYDIKLNRVMLYEDISGGMKSGSVQIFSEEELHILRSVFLCDCNQKGWYKGNCKAETIKPGPKVHDGSRRQKPKDQSPRTKAEIPESKRS